MAKDVNLTQRVCSGICLGLVASASVLAEDQSTQLPDPLAAGWAGKPVCQKLHDDHKQRILKCEFAPGVGHERHYHQPHFGYALSGGKMRITDQQGVRDVELETGSSFSSDGTVWHEVLNIGETPVTYLIVEPK